jgi:N-acetylglucosamine-6-phosphate deacetylase
MTTRSMTGRDVLAGEPPRIDVGGGRISAIARGRAEEAAWLAPGIIDLQVNGYDGVAQAALSGVCTLAEAVRMATENPGRIAGNRGLPGVGETADLIRFTLDPDSKRTTIETVLIEGATQS